MDEFNNRMAAQREVLRFVNKHCLFTEELCGLSRKAIERWLNVNRVDRTGKVAGLLFEISSKLFFLAAKSQEQITGEYQSLSQDVSKLRQELEAAIRTRQPAFAQTH